MMKFGHWDTEDFPKVLNVTIIKPYVETQMSILKQN